MGQAFSRILRAPKLKRGFSVEAEPQKIDVKPYATGFMSGALIYGLGRYLSYTNRPQNEVIKQFFVALQYSEKEKCLWPWHLERSCDSEKSCDTHDQSEITSDQHREAQFTV